MAFISYFDSYNWVSSYVPFRILYSYFFLIFFRGIVFLQSEHYVEFIRLSDFVVALRHSNKENIQNSCPKEVCILIEEKQR